MGARKLIQSLAALTVIGLAATGCTPEPAPTPTPIPSAPSVSESPTESPQERQQRVDYEAAEKAYRTFRAEYGRVLRGGGATAATPVMKAHATGDYLRQFVEVIQAYKGFDYHDEGRETIIYVRPGGHSANSVVLGVCEDDRSVKALAKDGKSLGPGEIRRGDLEVRKISGSWKVSSGDSEKANSCD